MKYGFILLLIIACSPKGFSQWNFDNQNIIYAAGGNVGIGSVSPDSKLTVNGSVHAKEVRVDLNVPGPDYVFEDDYDLPDLASVQKYVSMHKHLPGVPSAHAMGQEGINLSEMNMILLKKVEELTLYLFQLNQKLDELKASLK